MSHGRIELIRKNKCVNEEMNAGDDEIGKFLNLVRFLLPVF